MKGAPSSTQEQVLQRKQWVWKHCPTAFNTRSVILSPHREHTAREPWGPNKLEKNINQHFRRSCWWVDKINQRQNVKNDLLQNKCFGSGLVNALNISQTFQSEHVSSPCNSPRTAASRPCRRTASPAGGDGSSCNRSSWSGRVYPWPSLQAEYEREPRHTSHKPLHKR